MDDLFDVIIIGAGVVGCTILYELTKNGYRCLLLEKEPNLLSGASGGNSGIFHIPFDTKNGTLEHQCITNGRSALQRELIQRKIPHRQSGAIIIATDHEQVNRLKEIYKETKRSNVSDVKLLNKNEVKELEPYTSDLVLAGLLVPEETVVDSCLLPVCLAHDAIRMGSKILCQKNVTAGYKLSDKNIWAIQTTDNTFYSKLAINASGLYGDHVDQALIGKSQFRIKPRKGQFVVFEKAASKLLHKSMLYPVGTQKTRGVIIFNSVYGNLVIGPTAEETDEREKPSIHENEIDKMIAYGLKILPDLRNYKVIGQYAGLRPASQFNDFQIHPDKQMKYITVGGIRSTGLTASFGIASHILKQVNDIEGRSRTSQHLQAGATKFWVTKKPSYVLDGAEYDISHPLMKLGLSQSSKL